MPYKGFYINLERSRDRNDLMVRQLDALGLREKYTRFEAVNGAEVAHEYSTSLAPGELGCWLSHVELLQANREANTHIHVLEDDAIVHPLLAKAFDGLADTFAWDLLYTDIYFHPPPVPETFFRLKRAFQGYESSREIKLVNLEAISFTGTTSYFVNAHSIDKVLDLVDGQWTRNITIDLHLNQLVRGKKLTAFVVIPFLTTLSGLNSASTVGRQGPNLAALNLFRASFYAGADQKELYERIHALGEPSDTDPHLGVYVELLRHVLGNIRCGPNGSKPDRDDGQ